MHNKDRKSSWGPGVSIENRELFEERAETILVIIKQRFPGIPQSTLDISKIQYNRVKEKSSLLLLLQSSDYTHFFFVCNIVEFRHCEFI